MVPYGPVGDTARQVLGDEGGEAEGERVQRREADAVVAGHAGNDDRPDARRGQRRVEARRSRAVAVGLPYVVEEGGVAVHVRVGTFVEFLGSIDDLFRGGELVVFFQ